VVRPRRPAVKFAEAKLASGFASLVLSVNCASCEWRLLNPGFELTCVNGEKGRLPSDGPPSKLCAPLDVSGGCAVDGSGPKFFNRIDSVLALFSRVFARGWTARARRDAEPS